MSLYGMENFAYGDVAATFTNGQTTLSMFTGHTARFTTFPCMAVLFNQTDHDTPHEAFYEPSTPDAEIIEIVSKSGDTFNVIKRGQDGTSAIATTAGKTYRVAVIASRSQWLKTCRAPPDASGPFDAILEGTALAVANSVFRFIKDNGVDDAIGSIQGSATDGDKTELWLGDTTTADNVRMQRIRNSGVSDQLLMILNALTMIQMEGRNRMSIMKGAPGQAGGLDIGETVLARKFVGLREAQYTITAGGAVNDVNTPFCRIAAAGGPGSDDLDTINLASADIPTGCRVMLIIEPDTTAHDITVRDAVGNIRLNAAGGNFLMNAQDHSLCLLGDGVGNTTFYELFRTGP